MGEVSLQFKRIEATPITLDCSYCGERMWYTQVKKPVPPGAKDLDVYEGMWKCRDCNQTAPDFIVPCNSCGRDVVNFEDDGDSAKKADKLSERLQGATYPDGVLGIFGYFREVGFYSDDPYPARCLNCVRCEECGTHIDFGPDGRDSIPKMAAIDLADRYYTYFFFHKECLEKSPIYKNYQSEVATNKASFNKSAKSGCAGSLIAVVAFFLLALFVGISVLF